MEPWGTNGVEGYTYFAVDWTGATRPSSMSVSLLRNFEGETKRIKRNNTRRRRGESKKQRKTEGKERGR